MKQFYLHLFPYRGHSVPHIGFKSRIAIKEELH